MIRKMMFQIFDSQLRTVENQQKEPGFLEFESKVQVKREIPYGKKKGQTYDFIVSGGTEQAGKLPLIVNIHGGAFTGGDKACNLKYGCWLAEQGFQTALLNYRLVPKVNLKEQIRDAAAGILAAWKRCPESPCLYLTGDSSGSYLVNLLCCIWENPEEKCRFGVKLPDVPVTAAGLTSPPGSINLFPAAMVPFCRENRRMLLDGCPELDGYLDLKKLWNSRVPPLFLISCEGDPCYRRCLAQEAWIKRQGGRVESAYCRKKADGKLFHCFNVIRPDLECSRRVNGAMVDFFRKCAS